MLNHGYDDDGTPKEDIFKSIVSMQDIENIDHPLAILSDSSSKKMNGDEKVEQSNEGGNSSRHFDVRYDEYGNKIITSYIEDLWAYDKNTSSLIMFLLTEPPETTIIINTNSIYAESMILLATLNAITSSRAKVVVDLRWSNIVGYLLAAVAKDVTINETSCVVLKQFRVRGFGTVEKAKQLVNLDIDRIKKLYQILRSMELLTEEEIKNLLEDHDTSIWLYGDDLRERIEKRNTILK